MSRALPLVPVIALTLGACAAEPPAELAPTPTVRVDTIVVTREVRPPLLDGRATTLCLAGGETAEIRITPAGDTLVGPQRVLLADLGPGVGFVGNYAADETWFLGDEAVSFERREFRKFGQPESVECGAMKIVGDHGGVNLFAPMSASSPFETLYLPVRPGLFQPYRADVGRVRG